MAKQPVYLQLNGFIYKLAVGVEDENDPAFQSLVRRFEKLWNPSPKRDAVEVTFEHTQGILHIVPARLWSVGLFLDEKASP